MKKKIISIILFLCTLQFSIAQKIDTIEVSYTKTTILIFSSEVTSDDIGSPDVLIQKEGNKVKLAAAIQRFAETNLFIETSEGYYSFILKYKDSPKTLTKFYTAEQVTYPKVEKIEIAPQKINFPTQANTAQNNHSNTATQDIDLQNRFFNECELIARKSNSYNDVGVLSAKASCMLTDMYVRGDYMYFKITIKNMSNINYDVELIRFVVRNKKGAIKQAAVQEVILEPLYVFNGEINQVKGKDAVTKVFVFKKLTIADEKKLCIELWENGGDRILNFAITQDMILNTKKLETE